MNTGPHHSGPQPGVTLAPRGFWEMTSEIFFYCHSGEDVELAPSTRPGLLSHPASHHGHSAPNVHSTTRWGVRQTCHLCCLLAVWCWATDLPSLSFSDFRTLGIETKRDTEEGPTGVPFLFLLLSPALPCVSPYPRLTGEKGPCLASLAELCVDLRPHPLPGRADVFSSSNYLFKDYRFRGLLLGGLAE